ncbi:MAG: glucose-6-phosphate isomerase [Candidatus Eiseniibacteriota bacterium]
MHTRPKERLEWIRAPQASLEHWDRLAAFAAEVRRDGLARVLVCGMGGSSLAPRVLAASFGAPHVQVLDSTDPAAVLAAEHAGELDRTLFLITSKSGTTVETLAFYRYFAARARPEQFVAITDPGTPLERLARERGFRAVFSHPADVGGRYAALTVVGMLPAALLEADGRALLERALALDVAGAKALGERLADAARAGRDKLVLRPPTRVAGLAAWIEQLVAESAGKDGRGVIPVVDDPDAAHRSDAEVVTDFAADPLDLGAEFLRWEYATVELCHRLGVNAFDQPDVEAAKTYARAELERPAGAGEPALPTLRPAELGRIARPRDYLAVLAYLPPLRAVEAHLQQVRAAWGRALDCATTLGFGPRYLHSTGQLHKGGPDTGLFLVITAADAEDAEIPETGRTFGQLKRAQALGDIRALLGKGRRVAHVHLRDSAELEQLALV